MGAPFGTDIRKTTRSLTVAPQRTSFAAASEARLLRIAFGIVTYCIV